MYEVDLGAGDTQQMSPTDIHSNLVRLGVHIFVRMSAVRHKFTAARLRHIHRDTYYMKGWIHCPRANDATTEDQIFVCFRIMQTSEDKQFATVIVSVDAKDCRLCNDETITVADYVLPCK